MARTASFATAHMFSIYYAKTATQWPEPFPIFSARRRPPDVKGNDRTLARIRTRCGLADMRTDAN
jgi:hypothetical protein